MDITLTPKNPLSRRVLIIDLSYQLHRSLRVPEIWELKSTDPDDPEKILRTGGIMTVFSIIAGLMEKYPGFYPVLCSDKGLSSRRLALQPNYKGTLDKMNVKPRETMTAEEMREFDEGQEYRDTYRRSKAEIKMISEVMKLPYLEYEGVEGDDLMALVACHPWTEKAVVVTDDKDLIQLVGIRDDIQIENYRAVKREVIDREVFDRDYKSIDDFVLIKAICGDGSDNIPQVAAGVSGGTASKFVEAWRSAGLTNADIALKDPSELILLDGEIGGGEVWSGRGSKRVMIENKTPKFSRKVLDVLHSHSGHTKATQSMIKAMMESNQLWSNLEMIDLRKIEGELVRDIFPKYEDELDKSVLGDLSLMKVLSQFGRYAIKDLDVGGLVNKIKTLRIR